VTQSTWLEIPAPSRDAPRSRWRKLVLRLLLPLAFAALLWWLGLELAALLVVVAVVALTVIGVVRPTLSDRIEHGLARFGVIVGRAIALVLLTIVNLFVFTPIAFVMWVFRYDALAPGVRRDERSFWRAHTGRALPKHQFADERTLWSPVGSAQPHRRPILRVATAVGVVALILLADLGGGWIYDQVSNETHGTAAVADDTFDPVAQPALRDSPWAAEVLAEQTALPSVKDSFLGYRMGTKASQYTNIFDGVRKSYQSTAPGKKVSVWFFGASALFGDGQRDDHTIPSEFARLAEADGIPLEVRNYGRPGIAMWQELELFEQIVSMGQKPDLVVFYDGFNDLAWQMNVRLSPEPDNIFETAGTDSSTTGATAAGDAGATVTPPSSSGDGGTSFSDVVGAYWDQSASHHVYDAVHDLFAGSDQPSVQFAKGVDESAVGVAQTSAQITEAATNAVSIQARAANVATAIAGGVGAETAFFWQPSVFTKKLVPDEKAYLKLTGYQPERWVPAVDQARALLKGTPYVDLSTSLDGPTQPLLWDFVHTNEEGARLSAQAIYANLHDKLQQRIDSGAVTR
jgi:lysophospholipase L1-like esterase